MSFSHLSTDTDPRRVLLVDADSADWSALARALGAAGFVTYGVGTGADAWAFIRQWRPETILLSVSSHNRSGFDLCQQFKRSPHTQSIPILFLGQGSSPRDRLRAFELGGADFVGEPYWWDEVAARVTVHAALSKPLPRESGGRSPSFGASSVPLLANLQRMLHQQAVRLQEKNVQLQREVQERQQIEQALRHEQQKSEQLLLNILPEAIVTQLKQFHGSLAERFEEATVLFADIANFTPLAAQRSPLELVNLLNQIFSAFDRLADKHQLEKIKTIGDAYMVVGGVPVSHEHHAAAIADMALEMRSAIQAFRDDNTPLDLRIGINTGAVVAGVIGIKKFSYDLWGDTVNVANRMESQGVPGKIQVTETTYEKLKDSFRFEPAHTVEVKGKGRMRAYYLLGRR